MSENETQQVQPESSQASATGELAESEMESVAGGLTIEDTVKGFLDSLSDLLK